MKNLKILSWLWLAAGWALMIVGWVTGDSLWHVGAFAFFAFSVATELTVAIVAAIERQTEALKPREYRVTQHIYNGAEKP